MRHGTWLAFWLLAAGSVPALAGTVTVNLGDDPAGAGTCPAACSLRQAIATASSGDSVVFAPGLASPITLSQGPLSLNKTLIIQGPGAAKLTISAGNASQVLVVSSLASISGLTLADGSVTGSPGGNGVDGTGGAGSPGGSVGGACVFVDAAGALLLGHVAVRHCVATGGRGGNGGSGVNGSPIPPVSPGGPGGNGAVGGNALGGAILVLGSLSLRNASIVDAQARGGTGGNGGTAGFDIVPLPPGGAGTGGSAQGGALYAAAGASLRVANSTLASAGATGGAGGDAGFASFPTTGGTGGSARGGLIGVDASAALADLEFSTLSGGQVTGGTGGNGTMAGATGVIAGNALSAAATLTALSSVVVDTQAGAALCDGQVAASAGSVNLGEDNSCSGFSLHQSFTQLFHALDAQATPWPGYLPLYRSAVINAAATCQDLAAQTLIGDQHDTPRPQGSQCDLGAIEADYLFVDGFDG